MVHKLTETEESPSPPFALLNLSFENQINKLQLRLKCSLTQSSANCVFTDGWRRNHSVHTAHDKFTEHCGQRRQCVHQCCSTALIMNYQNDELLMSPGALELMH